MKDSSDTHSLHRLSSPNTPNSTMRPHAALLALVAVLAISLSLSAATTTTNNNPSADASAPPKKLRQARRESGATEKKLTAITVEVANKDPPVLVEIAEHMLNGATAEATITEKDTATGTQRQLLTDRRCVLAT